MFDIFLVPKRIYFPRKQRREFAEGIRYEVTYPHKTKNGKGVVANVYSNKTNKK